MSKTTRTHRRIDGSWECESRDNSLLFCDQMPRRASRKTWSSNQALHFYKLKRSTPCHCWMREYKSYKILVCILCISIQQIHTDHASFATKIKLSCPSTQSWILLRSPTPAFPPKRTSFIYKYNDISVQKGRLIEERKKSFPRSQWNQIRWRK